VEQGNISWTASIDIIDIATFLSYVVWQLE
jgi:hypothetical protein